MDSKIKQLFDFEGFGLAVAEYFMLKWNLDSSQYYSRINPEKIDTPDFYMAPQYDEQQTYILISKIDVDTKLAREVDGSYIKEIDKVLGDFLEEKPPASHCKYFGCTATIESFKIMARSGRRHLEVLEQQEAFKEDAKSALPENVVKKIDSGILPIFQRLVGSLNDNYRRLFNDVRDDEEIPDNIYAKLSKEISPLEMN
jgi:hypothetical protein